MAMDEWIDVKIKRNLMRFGVKCKQKGQIVKVFHGGLVTILANNLFLVSPKSKSLNWVEVRRL